jgi:hypothetical protein
MNVFDIYSNFINQKNIIYCILGIIGILNVIISFIFLLIIKYSSYKGFGIASLIYGTLIIVQSAFSINTSSFPSISSKNIFLNNNKVWVDNIVQTLKNETNSLFYFELFVSFLLFIHIVIFFKNKNKLFWNGYALSSILIAALTLILYFLLHVNYNLFTNQLGG